MRLRRIGLRRRKPPKMTRPWTLDALAKRAATRPEGYREAVLEHARLRDDGKYELTKADYDEITRRFDIKRPTLESIKALFNPAPAPAFGPGTVLHDKLKALFGADAVVGCGCKMVIEQMNRWGVEGCRKPENFKMVVDHLMQARHKLALTARNWADRMKQGAAIVGRAVTPEAIQRAGLEMLVNMSIDEASAKPLPSENAAAVQE